MEEYASESQFIEGLLTGIKQNLYESKKALLAVTYSPRGLPPKYHRR
jgi:hypothetical protein